jgi:ABC-type Fe3+ transport system permease subunit
MIVGRLIGWIFVILGLAVLGRDVIGWLDTSRLEPIVLGQLWYDIDRSSLNLAQAVIQRYIAPALWDPIISSLLLLWAAPFFLVLGALLVWASRRRDDRPARRRRR